MKPPEKLPSFMSAMLCSTNGKQTGTQIPTASAAIIGF
jgi:hypothetical protein